MRLYFRPMRTPRTRRRRLVILLAGRTNAIRPGTDRGTARDVAPGRAEPQARGPDCDARTTRIQRFATTASMRTVLPLAAPFHAVELLPFVGQRGSAPRNCRGFERVRLAWRGCFSRPAGGSGGGPLVMSSGSRSARVTFGPGLTAPSTQRCLRPPRRCSTSRWRSPGLWDLFAHPRSQQDRQSAAARAAEAHFVSGRRRRASPAAKPPTP